MVWEMEKWLNAEEVSSALGIHVNRVHTLMRTGKLGEVKEIDGYRRVSEVAVEEGRDRKPGRPRKSPYIPDLMLNLPLGAIGLDVRPMVRGLAQKEAIREVERILREAGISVRRRSTVIDDIAETADEASKRSK